ncbi:MAG: response regulator transcription factor [Clostridia bacterium]|nr:response regulator transcription factor [Clostridia bacterium]
MNKILVVEDEFPIVDLISISLSNEGYEVDYALDGEKGANLIETGKYDLVLLDIMLPKFNGYELLEYAVAMEIPVIFITAKGQLKDKVKGLSLGADDYIVKPFEIEELIARVNTVIRRCHKKVNIKDIEINLENRVIKKQGQEVKLTPKEFELFLYLYENQDKALKRENIYERVWADEVLDTKTLTLHIQRIRKKLDLKDRIKTIHGVGYIFKGKE